MFETAHTPCIAW